MWKLHCGPLCHCQDHNHHKPPLCGCTATVFIPPLPTTAQSSPCWLPPHLLMFLTSLHPCCWIDPSSCIIPLYLKCFQEGMSKLLKKKKTHRKMCPGLNPQQYLVSMLVKSLEMPPVICPFLRDTSRSRNQACTAGHKTPRSRHQAESSQGYCVAGRAGILQEG